MVRDATTIDLVIVERLSSDFAFATRSRREWLDYAKTPQERAEAQALLDSMRPEYSEDGVAIHYRVLDRLKGSGQGAFVLNGVRYPDYWGRQANNTRPVSLSQLKNLIDQQDLADWRGPGACEAPIFANVGRRFLIFRDAKGGPLRAPVPMQFDGERLELPGPAVVPVVTDKDPWVMTVRAALIDWNAARRAEWPEGAVLHALRCSDTPDATLSSRPPVKGIVLNLHLRCKR